MIRLAIAIAACLAIAGLWWHGYKKGERTDKQRSDLVIAGMVSDAQSRLAEANEKTRLLSASLQANKERAEHAAQAQKQLHERRLADQRATDDIVRGQLADFARGPGGGENPESTCRSDAQALGNVLSRALSAHGLCVNNAETEAGNARLLLESWPTITKATP
jgi:hypothetical protein